MRLASAATALIAAVSTFGSMAAAAPAAQRPPVVSVDPAVFYTGTWYEIGRRPMSLTNGCVAGGTTYTPKGEGAVDVRDFCHKGSPDGKLETIGGPAKILDAPTNARLHVSYRLAGLIPIGREYDVLAHDAGYRWFISSDPSFHDLWIYTRDPHPTKAVVDSLVERAKALGYDVSVLEFPPN